MTSPSDRMRAARAHRHLIDDLDREIEAARLAVKEAAEEKDQEQALPGLVVDIGRHTSRADRLAIQAYEDRITKLDREGR